MDNNVHLLICFLLLIEVAMGCVVMVRPNARSAGGSIRHAPRRRAWLARPDNALGMSGVISLNPSAAPATHR
jgi:hypothetical protein